MKRAVIDACNELQVPLVLRNGCNDCYRDMAVALWRVLSEREAAADESRQYMLRAGIDVIWRGVRINATTITDKTAKQYLQQGLPKDFFCKIDGKKYIPYADK